MSLSLASIASAGGSGSLPGLAEREVARRTARVQDAKFAIERGDNFYAEGDTEAALGQYRSAMEGLPDAPLTRDWLELAKLKFADCSVALARERAKNGRYEEARKLLAEALVAVPGHEGAIEFGEQLSDPDRWPPALTPEHVVKVQAVQRGLEMANSDYELGNYDKAIEDYQEVLRKDPYNSASRRGMERVEQKRAEYFETSRDHMRAKMLNDVNKMWEDNVPVQTIQNLPGIDANNKNDSARLIDKMNRIIFPNVQFSGASIEEAVEFLRVKSKDLDDQETDPAKKGVNIILKTGDTPITSSISIDLSDVPMSEALRYITELAGMKYKVEAHAVIVVPVSDMGTEMYQRIYRVPPDFLSVGGGSAEAAPAASNDPFAQPSGGGAGASQLIQRKSALEILRDQGIAFPEGASAVFNKVTSQLIVRNTQPNLDLIEAFVESLQGNTPKQIFITTKFVEVTQKNTDELGFDWLLGGFSLPGTNSIFGSGGTTGNSSAGPLSETDFPFRYPGAASVPVGQNPLSRGLRFGTNAIEADSIDGLIATTAAASSISPGILAFSGVFTDPQFQVVIRALSQKKGVDLMSAPSVTTKSGQRASVEVVREFIYPTEFDPPEIPQQFGSTGNTTFGGALGGTSVGGAFPVTPTTPTTFEMRPVGVRLEVDPVLGADGYTIDLNLAPEVTEFEGFINYGSPIQTTGSDALGNPRQIVLTENVINQPVFSSRKVQTSVTIWDGQTVAMGGLIREDVQDVEDKVPVLGDIPILGRLFQTKAEDHFKRNLMVFVTANVIDPSGQRVRNITQQSSDAGLPAATMDSGMGGPNPLLPAATN
ncbi:MAG: tetratricopeptide repeat protein [Verrucomicrobiales bacterium]|nr:tetratricopeptide repeat protein [Verrucomicrobiales bacterium]